MLDRREDLIDREFGQFLAQERRAKGVTVWDLARMSKIQWDRISELEAGEPVRGITREEATRLAAILEVPLTIFNARAMGEWTPAVLQWVNTRHERKPQPPAPKRPDPKQPAHHSLYMKYSD